MNTQYLHSKAKAWHAGEASGHDFAHVARVVSNAEKILRAYREQSAAGVGVFTVDGKMIDIAFIPGAERTLKLARACGMYEGDLV